MAAERGAYWRTWVGEPRLADIIGAPRCAKHSKELQPRRLEVRQRLKGCGYVSEVRRVWVRCRGPNGPEQVEYVGRRFAVWRRTRRAPGSAHLRESSRVRYADFCTRLCTRCGRTVQKSVHASNREQDGARAAHHQCSACQDKKTRKKIGVRQREQTLSVSFI